MRVVAPRLVFLVVEILDRLVVEQAVDGVGVRRRVGLVGAPADADPPVADEYREDDVRRQRQHGDHDEAAVVAGRQDADHQSDLHQRWQDRIKRVGDQAGNRAIPPLHVARDAPGLPFEVEAQRQRVQVPEDFQRHAPHGFLGDAGEKDLAQFGKQRVGELQNAVENEQQDGEAECSLRFREVVDHRLEDHRDGHVGQLGGDEAGEGKQHAPLVLPEIGRETADGLPRMRG
jgi:hypothetical protein